MPRGGKRPGAGRPSGRPSSFKPEYVAQARKLCELGATDREVAEFFGVSEATVYRWQHLHPEFREALKVGKLAADDRVEKSLYRRATGYSHDAVKIITVPRGANMGSDVQHEAYVEHIPPDVTACIFWLKNRRPDLWRDKRDVDMTVKKNPLDDLDAATLRALADALRDGSESTPAASRDDTRH